MTYSYGAGLGTAVVYATSQEAAERVFSQSFHPSKQLVSVVLVTRPKRLFPIIQ